MTHAITLTINDGYSTTTINADLSSVPLDALTVSDYVAALHNVVVPGALRALGQLDAQLEAEVQRRVDAALASEPEPGEAAAAEPDEGDVEALQAAEAEARALAYTQAHTLPATSASRPCPACVQGDGYEHSPRCLAGQA